MSNARKFVYGAGIIGAGFLVFWIVFTGPLWAVAAVTLLMAWLDISSCK